MSDTSPDSCELWLFTGNISCADDFCQFPLLTSHKPEKLMRKSLDFCHDAGVHSDHSGTSELNAQDPKLVGLCCTKTTTTQSKIQNENIVV